MRIIIAKIKALNKLGAWGQSKFDERLRYILGDIGIIYLVGDLTIRFIQWLIKVYQG